MLSLTSYIINLKSFYQPIEDIVLSGNDVNGKVLRVIFSQEASSIFTSSTKIYLKWHHQELDIQGYNIFTCAEQGDKSKNINPIWEIAWPGNLLREGHVIARIEKVDTNNLIGTDDFNITILSDPIDTNKLKDSDDFNVFSKAAIAMNQTVKEIEEWKREIEVEGIVDYTLVTNKPTLEGIELSGNKTLADFGFRAITDDEIEEIIQV